RDQMIWKTAGELVDCPAAGLRYHAFQPPEELGQCRRLAVITPECQVSARAENKGGPRRSDDLSSTTFIRYEALQRVFAVSQQDTVLLAVARDEIDFCRPVLRRCNIEVE